VCFWGQVSLHFTNDKLCLKNNCVPIQNSISKYMRNLRLLTNLYKSYFIRLGLKNNLRKFRLHIFFCNNFKTESQSLFNKHGII